MQVYKCVLISIVALLLLLLLLLELLAVDSIRLQFDCLDVRIEREDERKKKRLD